MVAVSSNAQQPAASTRVRLLGGLSNLWGRGLPIPRDADFSEDAYTWRRVTRGFSLFAAIALLGAFWGAAVAVVGLSALYLCVAVIGCAFILRDFRVGVVLLIILMPISRSYVFPHAMLGITGLNPLNLLLVGTLGSCLLHGLFDGSIRRFMPRPLLWLYLPPFLIASALGLRHIGEIAPVYFILDVITFTSTGGYVRDLVVKPLVLVVFALLVAAAVAKSERPEKFLVPTLLSVWVMSSMVVVFVYQSGVGLGELASSSARGFLSRLGLHANELGLLYTVAYALLLFTWVESKELWLRFALLTSMGLIVVALMLTFSRGAFLSFVVVNALFLLWRRNTKTLIFLVLLATGALFALPGAVYDRISTGFGEGLNAISAGRIQGLWLPLLPEVLRSPIYGNGLGSILWSEAMRVGGGANVIAASHPHNAYLETILDMGVAGLILVSAYFIHLWKGFRALSVDATLSPTLRGFHLGAAAGLLSFLIAAVTDSSLTPKTEHAFLWLAIGMMYGQRARKPAQ